MTASPDRLALYDRIDAALVAAGQHPTTPFWREQTRRFYLHPTATREIDRVGRGGAKSTHGIRVALVEMLSPWAIPPGERHFFAWVSENVDEAAQRPRQIEEALRILGIRCERSGNTVEIEGTRTGFKAFACRVGAVSGFRCIGFLADEQAKWKAADSSANPAGEVVASLRAMTITHPGAREWHVSSPLSTIDFHAEQFELGDTEQQITGYAATWTANPSVTEDDCRRKEPNERIFNREYRAIPQAALSSAFDAEAIAHAFRAPPEGYTAGRPVGLIDAARGGGDDSTFAVARWCWPPSPEPEFLLVERYHPALGGKYRDFVYDEQGRPTRNPKYDATTAPPPVLQFTDVGGFDAATLRRTSAANVIATQARLFASRGVTHTIGDQFESYLAASEFARHGLRHTSLAWSNDSKTSAVERIRRWMIEGRLVLPEHTKLRTQLSTFQEKVTPTGLLTFSGRGVASDDYVALVLLAAAADAEHMIPQAPYAPRSVRNLTNLPSR